MMKRLVILLCTIGFALTSCGEPKMDRIQRLLDVKLKTERVRLEAICKKDLIDKAIEQVDSTIIENALQDTSSIYTRPIRPDVPSLEIPELDTLGIKPLFGKSE